MASAAALAALFAATACGTDEGSAGSTIGSEASTSVPTAPSTTAAPTTQATTSPTTAAATTATPATAPATTARAAATTVAPTTARPTTTTAKPATTTTTYQGATCVTNDLGGQTCAVPGRPLRRRRLRRSAGAGLLLPAVDGADRPGDEARAEYASVASFGELALRLLAVGAPADLVAACHRAALDEIRHASVCDALAGRPAATFGSIPDLLGRRLGGWRRSRRVQLQRLAVESFLDGWLNEGAAAARLRQRAEQASSPGDQAQLRRMAADEQRHADLARDIVTWCFDEEPKAVGRVLARVAPLPAAA